MFLVRRLANMSNPSGNRALPRTLAIARHLSSSPSPRTTMSNVSNAANNAAAARDADILFDAQHAMRSYILNRPKKLNVLNGAMLANLRPVVEGWAKDDLVKLIVARGEGRAFCAGGDVAEVVKDAQNPETRDKALAFFKDEFEFDYLLATLGKPYIAIMDGITMGGGLGLSFPAPFRIATERSIFAMPESKIGYAPDVGASHFLAQLEGEVGIYLALTGKTLGPADALEIGLATHHIPSTRLPSLLSALSSLNDPTLSQINTMLNEHSSLPPAADALPKAPGDFVALTPAIRRAIAIAFSPAHHPNVESIQEALVALSLKRDAPGSESVAQWAKETLATLESRSPTSLRVALEAIRRVRAGAQAEGKKKGSTFGIKDGLRMELGIARTFVKGEVSPDFATGVSAVLINKTSGRPEWQPATLQEVTPDIVDAFFSPKAIEGAEPEFPSGAQESNPFEFALPSVSYIQSIVTASAPGSGGLALTRDEVVERVVGDEKWHGREGVREKVQAVLEARTEVDEGGYTKWIHQ